MISSVNKGSSAEKAGLQQGDLIVSYNGKSVVNTDDLSNMVSETSVGAQVEIQYIRGGVTKTTVATVGVKQ